MPEDRSLEIAYLKSLLDYDGATGEFRWKIRKGNRIDPVSMRAGTLDRWGHRIIIINKNHYMAHRLAWFYTYEEWPPYELDHINGLRDDNRIANLRLIDARWQQRANQKQRKDSRAPYKGIQRDGNAWMARCTKNGVVRRKCGLRSPEEAHAAYCEMANEAFGEFARSE